MSDSLRKEVIDYALNRLDVIDKKYSDLKEKQSQWRKAANKIHKDLTREVEGKPVISPNTYHNYLTAVRNAIKETGRKHPALASSLNRKGYLAHAVKALPAYANELNALAKMPASTVGNAKAMLKEQLHAELKGAQLDTAIEIVDGLLVDHPLVAMLVKSKAKREQRAKTEAASLTHKSQHLKQYNFPAVLALAKQSLASDSYTQVAWGIALLTGRRSGEVLHFGTFTKIDESTVLFEGQLKKRQGTPSEAYPIPVLADADLIIEAVKRLRAMPEVAVFKSGTGKYYDEEVKYSELPKHKLTLAINQRTNGVLNDRAKRLMKDPSEVFKNTRGIYARYCSDYVRPHSEQWARFNEDQFLKAILGHESVDEVKHYRQVSLAYEEQADWLKVPEETEDKAESTPANQEPVKKNWKAYSPIKALREKLDALDANGVVIGGRKVSSKSIIEFHDTKLRFWVAENPKLKITQSAIEKNKGNTLESGTGSVNVRVNRGTFQAWLKAVGAEAVEAYNAGKE
jgi:hypothetical protein